MNNLFTSSFSADDENELNPSHVIEMTPTSGDNLESFFKDVEAIKLQLQSLDAHYTDLKSCHEQSKTLHNAQAVKNLRHKMDSHVSSSLKIAKQVKSNLQALEKSNAASRKLPNSGPGTSSDRTRTSVISGLSKKLQTSMSSFSSLRETIASEYRDTVKRRYFTVTGENADETVLEDLISTGESETFLQKAIQVQGRGQVMDTISEIQERHDAVRTIEKNLMELHQVFLDMSVLVESQGEQLDNIESHVERASSYVRGGTRQLEVAKKTQRNTRKWTCYAILLLLIIIAAIVLSIRPWK